MNRIIRILKTDSDYAAEPLTLEELKLYLQVEGTAYDDQFEAYITAARNMVERATMRSLVDSEVMLRLNVRTSDYYALPYSPLAEIIDIRWKKCPSQVLPQDEGYDYLLDDDGEVAFLHYRDWYLTYTTTALIDSALTEAIKIQAGYMYMSRDDANAPKWHPRAKAIIDQYGTP